MKIIALVPIKNEAWILPAYLSSVRPLADEIIALDDGSTDDSKEIIERSGGLVFAAGMNGEKNINMSERRKKLLALGRERGGTHFIWLDADETFSGNFIKNGREIIAGLKPGEKLLMRWIALWKSSDRYRNDDSPFGKNFKDFVSCDDPSYGFGDKFLSEDRTPGPYDNCRTLGQEEGVVLHFQFAFWDRNQMKQAWYRCSELINGSRSAKQINDIYSITLEDGYAENFLVPSGWLDGIELPGGDTLPSSWHYDAILKFFNQRGIEFFEPLQIWHIKELHDEFVKKTGREPAPLTFHPLYKFLRSAKRRIGRIIKH